jgi:ATP-binding cassette subfamily B protein
VLLALRCYGRQMARLRRFTVPAMLLPALGTRAFTASRR